VLPGERLFFLSLAPALFRILFFTGCSIWPAPRSNVYPIIMVAGFLS